MKVKDAIKQLQNENWYHPNDDIMIGWCEFDDLKIDREDLTLEEWQEACVKADNSEYLFDMEVARLIVSDTADGYTIKLNKVIEWWNETDSSQSELEYELDYHNIKLSVDEFLKLIERSLNNG